jgi:hypothetical protein
MSVIDINKLVAEKELIPSLDLYLYEFVVIVVISNSLSSNFERLFPLLNVPQEWLFNAAVEL